MIHGSFKISTSHNYRIYQRQITWSISIYKNNGYALSKLIRIFFVWINWWSLPILTTETFDYVRWYCRSIPVQMYLYTDILFYLDTYIFHDIKEFVIYWTPNKGFIVMFSVPLSRKDNFQYNTCNMIVLSAIFVQVNQSLL